MSDMDQLVEDLERYYLVNDYRFVRAAIETFVAARVDPYRKALAFIAEHGRHSFDREQARAALAMNELDAPARLDEARAALARIGREERGSNPDHVLCGQCRRAVGHCDDDGECAGAVARAALREIDAP